MARKRKFNPKMPIGEIMREWPPTVSVLIGHRMHCIGCELASFHDAYDAAEEHDVDVDEFLKKINQAIAEETE